MANAMFFSEPQCDRNLMSIEGSVGMNNYFNYQQMTDVNFLVKCGLDPLKAAETRDYVIRALVLCADDNPMTMFDIMHTLWGYKEESAPAKIINRKIYCRTKYYFSVKSSVKAITAGAPVWVTLGTESYSNNGTASLPIKGTTVSLPGVAMNTAKIIDMDKSVPYNHKIKIQPKLLSTQIILATGQKLIPTLAPEVGGESCQEDGTVMPNNGRIVRSGMTRIRANYKFDKELLRGYPRMLQFALGIDPETGMEVDCWQPLIQGNARRDMQMTYDRYLLSGEEATNPDVQIDGYPGFSGYIPSVIYGGGQKMDIDPLYGVQISDLKIMGLYANANKLAKEFLGFMSLEVYMQLEQNIRSYQQGYVGACTYQAFEGMKMASSATVTGDSKVLESVSKIGIKSYDMNNFTWHLNALQPWSDPTMYGVAGYPYKNMALFLPAVPLKDSTGATVSPVQMFYPVGCGLSAGYVESPLIDLENMESGCDKYQGHMTRSFSMLTNCLTDHYAFMPSICQ